MIHYLRLWRRFVIMAFVREAAYRVNFALSIGEGAIQLVLAVLTFLLVYRFTNKVAGWSRDEVLVLVGVYRIVEGLIALQVAPNMRAIGGYIRRGDMDFLLLRPVASQFLVSLRNLSLSEGVNVLTGLALALYAGNLAGARWSLAGIGAAALFCGCGLVLLYVLWFLSVTLSFWLVQVDTLDLLFYGFFETARYPVSFFKGLARTLLTFVFPVAFATTFPAEALLGRADLRLLPLGLALAAAGLGATHLFWGYAVRHYSSASS